MTTFNLVKTTSIRRAAWRSLPSAVQHKHDNPIMYHASMVGHKMERPPMTSVDDVAAAISAFLKEDRFDPTNENGEPAVVGFTLNSDSFVEVGVNAATGPFLSVNFTYSRWSDARREKTFGQLLRLSAEQRFAEGWAGSLALNESIALTRPIPLGFGEREIAAAIGRAVGFVIEQPSASQEVVPTEWMRV